MKSTRVNSVEILKKLVGIPSYVDQDTDETSVADWMVTLLQKSRITTAKQWIVKNRYNILAGNIINPKIIVCGHMDTVRPSADWPQALTPTVKNGKLFGLGSSDMKAGLSVMATTLININPTNTLFLFYCDEEYDFLGMKAFVAEFGKKIKPLLIISMDGENLRIGHACRGLIELTTKVRGKTGHSGEPSSGTNAITNSLRVILKTESWIKQYKSKELGKPTLNVAYVSGGTVANREDSLGRQGNVIPDYCEYVLEVRPTSAKLTADSLTQFIVDESVKRKLKIVDIAVRHNLKPWITKRNSIKKIIQCAPKRTLASGENAGYLDVQMLSDAFGAPTICFGPAEPGTAHTSGEFVRIKNLIRAEQFLTKLLQTQS